MAALEIESMGFDHAELTTRLLGHWGLPEALVEAVGWDPQRRGAENAVSNPTALSRIVFLAELVAQLLADNRPQVLPTLMQFGREYRQLTEEKLERLVENLQNKVKQLADVLSLQLPEGTDYRDILIAAHSRLSAVAAETAEDLLTAQVNSPAAAKDEHALLEEVDGLSKAISNLTRKPKEKPAPAAVSAGGAVPAPRLANPPAHAANIARTAVESPRTYAAPAAPAETAPANSLMAKLGTAVASCRISRLRSEHGARGVRSRR